MPEIGSRDSNYNNIATHDHLRPINIYENIVTEEENQTQRISSRVSPKQIREIDNVSNVETVNRFDVDKNELISQGGHHSVNSNY